MAVYTQISDKSLKILLQNYNIGEIINLQPIAEGVENSNYLLETGGGKFVFTIYEKRVNIKELPFFLSFMDHLACSSLPCPVPIHDNNGNIIQDISGKACSIVSFLPGRSVKAVKNEHCMALGEKLAEIHLASQEFGMERKNNMSVSSWHNMLEKCKQAGNKSQEADIDYIEDALVQIAGNWPERLPSGVIHADLFPDNTLFSGSKITGIIDFYFSCNDFLVYDLAICMNAWCFERGVEFNITKTRNLLSAYNKVRKISEEELQFLPILASGAAMRFLLSRLYDALYPVEGAIVTLKDPLEYIQKLKFHMNVRSYREYGI